LERIVRDELILLPNFHPVRLDKHDGFDESFVRSSIVNNKPFKFGNIYADP